MANLEARLSPPTLVLSGAYPFRHAWRDVTDSIGLWRLWGLMGWNDILQRYRRSLLGPFWLTLSMAVMVGTLGFLYARLFNMEVHDLLPFLCLGLLIWGFISSLLTEGCMTFIGSEAYIKQIRLPFTLHACRMVWRNLIMFLHNVVVYVGVALWFGIWPGATGLLAIPGLLLIACNGLIIGMLFGMVSARFRDIAQIVSSLTQVIFFLTPIIWKPELLAGRGSTQVIADANPFYHFIQLVRDPLLGHVPSLFSYQVAVGTTIAIGLFSFWFFARYRKRIPYWI